MKEDVITIKSEKKGPVIKARGNKYIINELNLINKKLF